MDLRWYPIHTHGIPAGLADVELVGAVFCVESDSAKAFRHYGWEGTWPDTPLDAIKAFLRTWPEWTSAPTSLFLRRPYFCLESEVDLGNLDELSELRALGLVALQLLRERRSSVYFDLDRGVTGEGKALLRKMADLGMLLDLSHLHGPVLEHILAETPGPRLVSHVVCGDIFPWSLTRRANAMTDTELRACAAELYGVPFVDDLVSPKPRLSRGERQAGIGNVVDHLIRLVEVVGRDRVALGPDYFDYSSLSPTGVEVGTTPGLEQKEGLAGLWQELRLRGLSEADVAGIFWGNAARVFPPKMEGCL